ncbi:hypothetical protein [Geopsychrobacter electrodiphilus]|uniref:hypothetical protein n=1 Tax=Geopsychrobacter electrodiphilus TaxID=225196 RepID=UPI0003702DE4|nr:hypothetical protein [Geopsychrobacter electrodiphilus]
MLDEIRNALEKTAKMDNSIDRAEELDVCLTWIEDELEGCGLTDQELERINNIRKAHCREFIESLSGYGNSGYEEAGPLAGLFLHHIQLWGELGRDDPELLTKVQPFFVCIE